MAGYGSEELWWQRPRGNAGNDETLGLLTGQKSMDVDQSRRRGDAELESKRNLADVYGEAPKNAVKMYWQGAEEGRRGQESDQRLAEAKQRMDLAQSEEGRRGTRFDWETEKQPYEMDHLRYGKEVEDAMRPGISNRVFMDDENKRLGNKALQHGMDYQDEALGLQRQGLGLQGRQVKLSEEGNRFAQGQAERQELANEYQMALNGAAQTGNQEAINEVMQDPRYASLNGNFLKGMANKAMQVASEAKAGKGAAEQQIFNMTPQGQRVDTARANMMRAEQFANDLDAAGRAYEANLTGGVYEREAATKAVEDVASKMNPADAAELRNATRWGKSSVMKEVAARQLAQAALEMEQASVNAPPAIAAQDKEKARILRVKAEALKGSARRSTLIDYSAPPQQQGPGTTPAGGMTTPDPMGLLRKGNRG